MKCDELRDFEVVLSTEYQFVGGVVFRSKKFYSKDSVDEAIDELKQKLHDAEMAKDDAEAANTEYRADIAALKAENERLTIDKRDFELRADVADATIEKLKSNNRILAHSGAEKIKENAELARQLRTTQRALWLARAMRAADRARIFYFNDLETILDIDGYSYDSKKKKGCKKLTARQWRIIWLKVQLKCRAKAEEYK